MASAVKNQDDTFTVTLDAREQQIAKRWGQETGRTKAEVLARVVESALRDRWHDFKRADGASFQQRYEALPDQTRAQIDALLG